MKYQTINQVNKGKICNGLDVTKYTLTREYGKNSVSRFYLIVSN